MSIYGYTVTNVWCRKCAPGAITDSDGYELTEDTHDYCDVCGDRLAACQHEWGDWTPGFTRPDQAPQQIRFCNVRDCGEAEWRDALEPAMNEEQP